MSRIKVTQIALVSQDGDTYAEYLDDKGRVWYQVSVRKTVDGRTFHSHYEWKQLDLPEETK